MTGYGVAEGPAAGGRLQCEVRTVNHRHLNIHVRLPGALQSGEEAVRALVRRRLERGHVSIGVRWLEEPEHRSAVGVDLVRARQVVEVLTRLRDELGLDGAIDVALVARQPEVLTWGQEQEAAPGTDQEVTDLTDRALLAVIAMREREGVALTGELSRLLDAIDAHLTVARDRAPARVEHERDRLRAAVSELLEGRTVNEDRLAQEIAFLAERLDVREEIVRLETHLAAARAALAGSGPVGRELSFLAQEMLREINTIGSKANDAPMAQAVIAMKSELEKFREQIENLE